MKKEKNTHKVTMKHSRELVLHENKSQFNGEIVKLLVNENKTLRINNAYYVKDKKRQRRIESLVYQSLKGKGIKVEPRKERNNKSNLKINKPICESEQIAYDLIGCDITLAKLDCKTDEGFDETHNPKRNKIKVKSKEKKI